MLLDTGQRNFIENFKFKIPYRDFESHFFFNVQNFNLFSMSLIPAKITLRFRSLPFYIAILILIIFIFEIAVVKVTQYISINFKKTLQKI